MYFIFPLIRQTKEQKWPLVIFSDEPKSLQSLTVQEVVDLRPRIAVLPQCLSFLYASGLFILKILLSQSLGIIIIVWFLLY